MADRFSAVVSGCCFFFVCGLCVARLIFVFGCFRDEGAPAQDGGKTLTEDDIETNWDECIETFDAMELREELLRGIYAYGFEKPSAIQQV